MTDVTFGGILTSLYDYTGFENTATGRRGALLPENWTVFS